MTSRSGVAVLCDTSVAPHTFTEVLPLRALDHVWPMVTHVIDRGSIGASSCYHIGQNHFWLPFWDVFHGQWRSIKAVSKDIRWMWLSILQVLPVLNMNHGPFRSKVWRRTKAAFATRWLSENTVHSPDFVQVAPLLAQESGNDANTADGLDKTFASLEAIPTFNQAGSVMKLMRWMSIGDVWEEHRPYIYRHRFLLERMAYTEHGVRNSDVLAGVSRAPADSEEGGRDDPAAVPEQATPETIV